ncbi:hypothetical protein DOY81_001101 [Sarcophaga bullata]|nr:hypothetical protein DOY81_001101 [Sarcophaga bullata]
MLRIEIMLSHGTKYQKKIVDLRPSGENKSLVCQRITNNMAIPSAAAAGCENFVFIFNSNFITATTTTSTTINTTTTITTD